MPLPAPDSPSWRPTCSLRARSPRCLLAAAAALAQGSGEPGGGATPPRGDFAALDRNRDGYLTRIEAAADPEIAKRFLQFDADKDLRLAESEYVSAQEDNQKRALRDAALTARVKAALHAERGLPSMAISVETYEGRVQLSGFVHSPETASRAGRVTASVSGVRTVHNNIVLK